MPIHIGLEVPLNTSPQYKLIETQLAERFRTMKVKGEFVPSDHLSITLCFMGHLSEKSMEKLSVLRAFASFYSKQTIIVNGFGGVPTWEAARGLWLTCRKTDAITTIQELVQQCIQREDLPAEMKNFFPRINICKFPTPANVKELRFGIPALARPYEFTATNLVVYETEILDPNKVTAVKTFPLAA